LGLVENGLRTRGFDCRKRQVGLGVGRRFKGLGWAVAGGRGWVWIGR